MKYIVAIDPGTTESAYVLWGNGDLAAFGQIPNDRLVGLLPLWKTGAHLDHCVIEMIGHYGTGMPAGKEIFDTCVWIGRFTEAFGSDHVSTILRATVKAHICGSARAKDANIRQALIDRFGKASTKKGGILHGVSRDVWAALALAVTFWDQRQMYETAASSSTAGDRGSGCRT